MGAWMACKVESRGKLDSHALGAGHLKAKCFLELPESCRGPGLIKRLPGPCTGLVHSRAWCIQAPVAMHGVDWLLIALIAIKHLCP